MQEHLICVPFGSALHLSTGKGFREPPAADLSQRHSLLFCLGCNSQVTQLGLQRGLVKAEASFLCAEGLQVTVEKKQSLFLACL